MITFDKLTSDAPELAHSRLLLGFERTFEFIADFGPIGLTQIKAFNRKFVSWAVEHFNWPGYSSEEMYAVSKVLNEDDFLPVMVVHDLMIVMKLGRHYKSQFRLTKRGVAQAQDRGTLFSELTETYLFRYNHARTSRFDFSAPGNWDTFLNIINVEAEGGVTAAELVKIFYGLEPSSDHFDREYHAHKSYLHSRVLRPLSWIGFLEETKQGSDLLSERVYTKSPLWRACLRLSTDGMAERPVLQ